MTGIAYIGFFHKTALMAGMILLLAAGNTIAVQIDLNAAAVVGQSTSMFPASNAIDDDVSTFTHTSGVVDDYWIATFHEPTPIDYIEIVNRNSCCDSRMDGLVLRLLDENNNTLDFAALSNPGLGGTWSYEPDSTITAKVVRVGLENGETNGDDNYYVTLAEARFFADVYEPPVVTLVTNSLAFNKDSYMVRLNDTIPPTSYGNDGNLYTETETTATTVDGYWEVDLGADYAITNVTVVAPTLYPEALAHTTLRIFDLAHNSVFSQKLDTAPPPYCAVNLPPTYIGRYVRVSITRNGLIQWDNGLIQLLGGRDGWPSPFLWGLKRV
jgi:hypothetical protein